jgi:hypothetical protein
MFLSCLVQFALGFLSGLFVLCGLLALGACLGGAKLNRGHEDLIDGLYRPNVRL